MQLIDIEGMVIIFTYTVLRFGVPIVLMALLCKALPRFFPNSV